MTTSLAEQQRVMVSALAMPQRERAFDALASSGTVIATPSWQRGIAAYRSNAAALAVRALQGAYPVVAQLLGADNFEALARNLWRQAPPEQGDITCWGGALPNLIASTPGLHDAEPYLADLARAEWCMHRAGVAADGQVDMASLQLLVEHDPSDITLVLAAGTACVASAYPIASILNAHLEGEPSMQEASRQLHEQVAQTAVIWRAGLKPRVRETLNGEAELIAGLQENRSLADSLSSAGAIDFNAWLSTALHSGLLLCAERF